MIAIDLSQEMGHSFFEYGVILVIFLPVVFYLWRQFFSKKRRGCGACPSNKAGSACCVLKSYCRDKN